MTDRDKWKEFFNSMGVEWLDHDGLYLDNSLRGVTGYHGFYIEVNFTPEGKFLEIGAWE